MNETKSRGRYSAPCPELMNADGRRYCTHGLSIIDQQDGNLSIKRATLATEHMDSHCRGDYRGCPIKCSDIKRVL